MWVSNRARSLGASAKEKTWLQVSHVHAVYDTLQPLTDTFCNGRFAAPIWPQDTHGNRWTSRYEWLLRGHGA